MHQLQILGDEFNIDQPPGGIFEIPRVGIALLFGDSAAHVDDVAGGRSHVPLLAKNLANNRRDLRAKIRRSGHDAGASERHVFPRPGFVLLVAFEALDLGGDRTRPARWT